jgi:dipeptidyl aminopeptidase/acylaminoacyl peptidase
MTISPDHGPIQLTGTREEIHADGLVLPVLTYHPTAQGRRPAVIVCPGGNAKGMFEVMEWISSRLAAAGYLAITMSWRDASPLNDPLDIGAAMDWLRKRDDVDPERVGIMGISRGANAALRAAADDQRLRSVATLGAVTDLLQQSETTAAYAPARNRMLVSWLGDPVENRAYYEQISAVNSVHRITQPTLLIHGAHDMHAPVEHSIWVKEKMDAAGAPDVELEVVPMMGHYGDLVPNDFCFGYLGERFIGFFDRTLRVAMA